MGQMLLILLPGKKTILITMVTHVYCEIHSIEKNEQGKYVSYTIHLWGMTILLHTTQFYISLYTGSCVFIYVYIYIHMYTHIYNVCIRMDSIYAICVKCMHCTD